MFVRGRETIALGAALLLHATGVAVLSATHGEPPATRAKSALRSEVELPIELDAPVAVARSEAAESTAREESAHRVAGLSGRVGSPALEQVHDELAIGELTPEAAPEPESVPDRPAADRPIDLGIGPDGWQRWVTSPKAGERPAGDDSRVRAIGAALVLDRDTAASPRRDCRTACSFSAHIAT